MAVGTKCNKLLRVDTETMAVREVPMQLTSTMIICRSAEHAQDCSHRRTTQGQLCRLSYTRVA